MKRLFQELIQYIAVIFGALVASFSVACILLPNDAIDYGTAGIGIIISKLTGLNLSLCVFLTFLPFLILGAVLMDKRFFIKALLGSLSYTLALEWFDAIPFTLYTEHFLAVAFGGAILGAGLSLILRFGGCIDGSEIFANVIVSRIAEKRGKNLGMTGILIGFNVCVYLAAFFFIDRNGAMLSLLVYVVATLVIDRATDRFEAIKQVTVITQNEEELVSRIRSELKKTCTVMRSYGAISGENSTVICYVTYFELFTLKEIIRSSGIKAFVTVSSVDEILSGSSE